MVEVLVDPVRDGPVGVQRGKAALAGLEQELAPLDVQVSFLLAGKAGVGKVFGGGARAHGDVEQAAAFRQPLVACHDRLLQVFRQLGIENQPARQAPPGAEVVDVAGVEPLQYLAEPAVERRLTQKIPVRLGSHCKSVGDLHPLWRELAVHLAQRRVLAADERHVVDADLLKPAYMPTRRYTGHHRLLLRRS